jgi:hypothetical protein
MFPSRLEAVVDHFPYKKGSKRFVMYEQQVFESYNVYMETQAHMCIRACACVWPGGGKVLHTD